MPSPFLALPGAVEGSRLDAGVAAHYGNPLAEQRALVERGGIVDLSHLGVLTVAGPDRQSWLNSMTSQLLLTLQPGEPSETLVFDPAGHVQHAATVVDDGERTWLITEHGEAGALQAFLESMRFMLRVEIEDVSGDFAVVGRFGEVAVAAVDAAGHVTWRDDWPTVGIGGHGYGAPSDEPWTWSEIIVPRTALAGIADEARRGTVAVAGTLALEALRIAAHRPRFGREVDEKTIPHELDWLRTAVHLNKGCYRGQETIAKVHNLGHPPRRLVMLHLDGSDAVLPAPGTTLTTGDTSAPEAGERKEVGHITSSAIHHELGPVALAVVKRTTPTDAVLHAESGSIDVAASQEVIVPVDAGAEAHVPRIPRLGAVTRRPRA